MEAAELAGLERAAAVVEALGTAVEAADLESLSVDSAGTLVAAELDSGRDSR